jgi:selenocysteine lyase/cysteine desulfurase
MKKRLYDEALPPTFGGGGTVAYVSRTSHAYLDDCEAREDAGTPGILQLIRAAEAYALRNAVGLEVIHEREEKLGVYVHERFSSLSGITLYSSRTLPSVPIFSFNVEGMSPYTIADILSREYGIQTRAGCSCAGPYGHDLLGIQDGEVSNEKPGWVRVGFTYIHTERDVDYFFSALNKIVAAK